MAPFSRSGRPAGYARWKRIMVAALQSLTLPPPRCFRLGDATRFTAVSRKHQVGLGFIKIESVNRHRLLPQQVLNGLLPNSSQLAAK